MEREKLDKALEGAKAGNIRNILALRGGETSAGVYLSLHVACYNLAHSTSQIPRSERSGALSKEVSLAHGTWLLIFARSTAIILELVLQVCTCMSA